LQLLITGGDCALARAAIAHLHPTFQIRAVDTSFSAPLPGGVEQTIGDLRDEAFVKSALQGVETVLHFAPLSLNLADDRNNLDHTVLGAWRLAHVAKELSVARIILGSSMTLFATAPQQWRIGTNWRPRPQARLADLCAYLSECALRELAREEGVPIVCVRFGAADETLTAAVDQALAAKVNGWRVLHAIYKSPVVETAPTANLPTKPIKKVVIFGVGGPLGAVTAAELAPHYQLRLTDVKPIAEIIAAGPRKDQSPGAPMPIEYGAPHEEMVVDVTDPEQVLAACAGMDAIINLTVIRHHVPGSFLVNAVGAYNVMQAALAHNIRRVVHTGPFQIGQDGAAGYNWDGYIVDDVPSRPGHGMNSYLHSKYLGQEIVRIFAEQYQFDVPTLLFCNFMDFVYPVPTTADVGAFSTTWTDSARALRAALEVATLPSPFEILHINGDLPHGVFPNTKAKRILGWAPQDPLESWWHDAQ